MVVSIGTVASASQGVSYCRVEDWRASFRGPVADPSLSLRASVRLPWPRFQSPLIKPDMRISRIRLSDEIMPSPTESGSFAVQGG